MLVRFPRPARLTCILLAVAALFAPIDSVVAQFQSGEVFVAVGNGQVKRFASDGTLIQTLSSGAGATYTTGMGFDADGNLYVTNFGSNNLTKYDNTGTLVAQPYVSGINSNPESIAFDASGNMYVGTAGGNDDVLKYSSTGTLLTSYNVTAGPVGSDWIDMASDGCTVYYTGEGTVIYRYDVCTSTQLTSFATVPAGPAFALRIRSNGEVLVAATNNVYRYSSTGSLLQTYPKPAGASTLFALNLDPDGTSFWTADINNGSVYRIDIATGSLLTSFASSPNTLTAGLAIFNEPLAVCVPPSVTDQPDDLTVCPGAEASFTVTATGDGTLGYQWRKDGVDIPGANSATYTIASVGAGDAGDYSVVVSGDCDPDATSDDATLTVSPSPTFSVTASPSTLWPPNGSMYDIAVTIDVSAGCQPSSIVLESITSDETDNNIYSNADFNSSPADVAFNLKGRRDGNGDGRVYTITYRMYYPIGGGLTGSSTASTTVTVEHDQGN